LTLTYTLTNASTHGPQSGITIELYLADEEEEKTGGIIDRQVTDMAGRVSYTNLVAGTYYLDIPKQAGFYAAHDIEVVK